MCFLEMNRNASRAWRVPYLSKAAHQSRQRCIWSGGTERLVLEPDFASMASIVSLMELTARMSGSDVLAEPSRKALQSGRWRSRLERVSSQTYPRRRLNRELRAMGVSDIACRTYGRVLCVALL